MEIKIWEEVDEWGEITYKAKVEVVYDNISKTFEEINLDILVESVEEYIRETFTK